MFLLYEFLIPYKYADEYSKIVYEPLTLGSIVILVIALPDPHKPATTSIYSVVALVSATLSAATDL
jgi:hypothetical protein